MRIYGKKALMGASINGKVLLAASNHMGFEGSASRECNMHLEENIRALQFK